MIAEKRKYRATKMHPRHREKFWRFVDKKEPDECWPWIGTVTASRMRYYPKGTPITFIKGKTGSTKPQSVAWEAAGNVRDYKAKIVSSCGNFFCCNPGHLRQEYKQEAE